MVNIPWYVPNHVTQRDLIITSVQEEIQKLYTGYKNRLTVHPNNMGKTVIDNVSNVGQ